MINIIEFQSYLKKLLIYKKILKKNSGRYLDTFKIIWNVVKTRLNLVIPLTLEYCLEISIERLETPFLGLI